MSTIYRVKYLLPALVLGLLSLVPALSASNFGESVQLGECLYSLNRDSAQATFIAGIRPPIVERGLMAGEYDTLAALWTIDIYDSHNWVVNSNETFPAGSPIYIYRITGLVSKDNYPVRIEVVYMSAMPEYVYVLPLKADNHGFPPCHFYRLPLIEFYNAMEDYTP